MSGESADLLVVGGGPVGLAAAVEATLRGLRVVVVEPRRDPVDKACGEGLMPGAVQALDRLGVRPTGRRFDGISYLTAQGRAGGRHAFAAGPGLGVRRTTLHEALRARADALGVRIAPDRVVGLAQDGERVRVRLSAGGVWDAPWAFGCDGLASPTRAMAGIGCRADGRRFGLRRHAVVPPWASDVQVYWADIGEAYVTPVADDLVGVALLTSGGWTHQEALDHFPALRARLGGAAWAGPVRGAGPLRRQVERRVRGRVLLVGDAAGYVDALTGEGLRVGFACASAAVDAVQGGAAESYESRWRELTRGYRWLTSGLVTATRVPAVRAAVVPASRRLPAVFGRAVESLASGAG